MPDLTEEAGLLRLLRRPDDGALAVTEKVCKAINAGVAATGFSIEVLDQGHGEAPVALAQPGHQGCNSNVKASGRISELRCS